MNAANLALGRRLVGMATAKLSSALTDGTAINMTYKEVTGLRLTYAPKRADSLFLLVPHIQAAAADYANTDARVFLDIRQHGRSLAGFPKQQSYDSGYTGNVNWMVDFTGPRLLALGGGDGIALSLWVTTSATNQGTAVYARSCLTILELTRAQ